MMRDNRNHQDNRPERPIRKMSSEKAEKMKDLLEHLKRTFILFDRISNADLKVDLDARLRARPEQFKVEFSNVLMEVRTLWSQSFNPVEAKEPRDKKLDKS